MAITPIQNLISAVLSGTQPVTSPASSGSSNTAGAVQAVAGSASVSSTSSTSSASSTPAALLATANLQNASVGLAQLSSLLEEAQSGTQQIGSILQQLQSLAGEAENDGPPSALAALDGEFQQLLIQLNQVAASTSFDGTNLLDGSSGANDNAASSALTLPDLTASGLFGNTSPNLLSAANATAASAAITNAQNVVSGTDGNIAAAQAEVSFTTANVDTALANNNASTAVLSENDLTDGSTTGDFLAGLLANLGTTASAQTGNLSGALLSLLQE